MGKSILLLFSFVLFEGLLVEGRELRRVPEVCSNGQSHWCQNITTAAECMAVKHCIQGVWELERPIEVDKSQICQTCLDMVKQARDQLLSNQTEEEIKEVLEGTCNLIPIEVVKKECAKLMDQFGSNLVDMLASQMDPQVVCSVAGLCDNSRVHRLEAEYMKEKNGGKLNCDDCNVAANAMKNHFVSMEPQFFLNILNKMCLHVSSYSEGCQDIAMREHVYLLDWLRSRLRPEPVCFLAGVCIIKPQDSISQVEGGLVAVRNNDDLPCELCLQLVQHLKDILVSNTTEEDFKLVLTGICNQLTSYKDECLSLVNTYYSELYLFLTKELDGKLICGEVKLCPTQQAVKPLISVDTSIKVEPFQLPVTRYNPITYVPSSFVNDGNSNDQILCSMCEFFLHFVQQEITLPSSEEKIKHVVENGCAKLPSSISDQCKMFVDTYMDEFIALLAQEIDPSQVCPMLAVCPRGLVAVPFQDKPTCPLCLLAFQEINNRMKNLSRTAGNVSDVVNDLCIRDEFPDALAMECVKFVMDHRSSIVDMVLTEFTPQESCAYINLCIPTELNHHTIPETPAGSIDTNEIRDGSIKDSNTCVLCEFIMTKVASMLKDKKTEEEIKDAVFHVCDYMPSTISPKCRDFLTQYADLIIELLAQEIDPKQACTHLGLCTNLQALMRDSMKKCLLCEVLMDSLRTVMTDPNVDDNLNIQLKVACQRLPFHSLYHTCWLMVEEVVPQIEMALRTLPVGPLVCRRVFDVCSDRQQHFGIVPSQQNCLKGSSYWCISSAHAALCNAIEYCQQEVWKGNKPKKGHNKGRITILN